MNGAKPRIVRSCIVRSKLEAIYLLDDTGLTVASSNYQQTVTFLGQNYGFRNYFKQAMAGEVGRFFAIGATTSRPGYFVAAPVRVDGEVRGALVIKDDLQGLADLWASSSESVLVSNRDQVVVLTSDPEWRYKTLEPLDDVARDRVIAARQFGTQALTPLEWMDRGERAVLDGVATLHVVADVGTLDWTLHYFAPEALVRNRAAFVTVSLAVFLALVLAVALFVRVAWRPLGNWRRRLPMNWGSRSRRYRPIWRRQKLTQAAKMCLH